MSSCAIDFDQLAGLDRAKNAVARILGSSSDVHAVMLYGPQGAGKRSLASVLAKSWLCPTPTETGAACGTCVVCLSFDAGKAVDFRHWRPWGPQSLIKLSCMHLTPNWEQDKERPALEFVVDFIRTRPIMARHKVVLFQDADRMNTDAANAFLKTLEEPPPGVKLILTTSHFSRVLPTIRSRCMCLACELPTNEAATFAGGHFSPVESVFGGSPGGVAHVRSHHDVFQSLFDVLEAAQDMPLGAAFLLAEQIRDVADRYADATKLGARAANVKIVEAVSDWLSKRHPELHPLLSRAAESHRLLLGNAQPGPVFEVLAMDLLYHLRERSASSRR